MFIRYNGVDLSNYIKIVKVNRGILPDRENKRYDIVKSSGSSYSHYRYREKIIPVEFLIIDQDLNSLRRLLANLLDVDGPSELIFSDEPHLYWLAVPDGSIDLDEILTLGKGTINFLCPKPWAYSVVEKTISLGSTESTILVKNDGSVPANPKIKINFHSDCGFVGLTSPKGSIQVGNKISADTEAIPKSENLISSTFSGIESNTWGKNVFQPLHINAQASGTVAEDVYGVRTNSFGTWIETKKWHGPVISKDLSVDTLGLNTADNWEVYSEFHFRTLDGNASKAMAMMEFNVFDDAGDYITGVRFGDTLDVYPLTGSLIYVGKNPNELGIEQAVYWDEDRYDYFNGSIYISKMANNFRFVLHNYTTGKILNKTFYNDIIGAKKAKTAAIFMGKFKDNSEFNDMSVTYFKFVKHHTQNIKDVPNIFSDGDELIIDNETGKVTKNGSLYLETLDIGSKFFQVDKGTTGIDFTYSDWLGIKPEVTITIREKFY